MLKESETKVHTFAVLWWKEDEGEGVVGVWGGGGGGGRGISTLGFLLYIV